MRPFGKVIIKDVEGNFYQGIILVSDTFENNNNLRCVMMIEFDNNLPENKLIDERFIDYIVFRLSFACGYFYGFVNVERVDGEIDTKLNDLTFDEDYRNGNVSRLYMFLDNEESVQLLDNNFAHIFQKDLIHTEIKREMEKPFNNNLKYISDNTTE